MSRSVLFRKQGVDLRSPLKVDTHIHTQFGLEKMNCPGPYAIIEDYTRSPADRNKKRERETETETETERLRPRKRKRERGYK